MIRFFAKMNNITYIISIIISLFVVFSTSNARIAHGPMRGDEQEVSSNVKRYNDFTVTGPSPSLKSLRKCLKQSILLTKQALNHELDTMNNYNQIWFNDLDKDELLEKEKQSLASILMSGSGQKLLSSEGHSLFEVESSYFRPPNHDYSIGALEFLELPINATKDNGAYQSIGIKLMRRHQDRCQLNTDKGLFTYVFGLSVGPFEHNLDVLYHLPKDLGLTQPIDWKYAQVKMLISKMNYEITLRQKAHYHLGDSSGCPIEIVDVTYLSNNSNKPHIAMRADGFSNPSNTTLLHLERLFNDYTRPTISARLRQMLKFYLNGKTLPLNSL